jgi:predicted SAM-dependent methyltransferase
MERRLHIGGQTKAEGWEILDANPGPHVDHVCNANNLSGFADNTFSAIYASHVVEHLDYIGELSSALRDWNRILLPGGKLYVSVPDLDILATMILDKQGLTRDDRFLAMRMIFGGHTDKYDYHVTGLNEEFLSHYLSAAGFLHITKVKEFGLFHDTSTIKLRNIAISLNMIAEKRTPPASGDDAAANQVGRNQKCFCGSGEKYKHCHGKLN